jgi:hypothetical protein
MTQEEFISILDREDYSYEIEGDKIIVTCGKSVWFESLTSLPPGVEFKNRGHVSLSALTSLSSGVKFENGGDVYLQSLTSLSPGVEFKNRQNVWFESLTSLPPGVVFKNGWNVYLNSIIGGWFNEWKGNIEGIDSKRLLNMMIKQGVFER